MDPQVLETAKEYGLPTFLLFAIFIPAIIYLERRNAAQAAAHSAQIAQLYQERLRDFQQVIGVVDASKVTLQGLNANLEQRARMWELTAEAQRASAEAQKSLAAAQDKMREQLERLIAAQDRVRDDLEKNSRKLDDLVQRGARR